MQQTKLAEVFYKEYCDVLTKDFRSYLEKELFTDVIFLCKNNKKVPAHQIVLGSFSSLLYQLFSDHQQYFKGHIAYICVPDIRANSLQNILQFIYYGKVALKNRNELSRLYEDLILLDLPSSVVTSETEPFCTYISGIKSSNDINQLVGECTEMTSESSPSSKIDDVSDNYVASTGTLITEGVSSSSSLPVILSVITLDPAACNANAKSIKNSEEIKNSSQEKQDINSEQQITSSEDSSRSNMHLMQNPVISKLHSTNNAYEKNLYTQPATHSAREEASDKKKNHLLAVLKKVTIACQNLESVGVSDDEKTRTNLQSRLRIVKQCIVDINDLLSTEVTVSSYGNHRFIDVERDYELKIMLDNCLETLPRLEKAIENCNGRSKRYRRRERRESVDRLDYQKILSNENASK